MKHFFTVFAMKDHKDDLWECFTEVPYVICLFLPNLTYIPCISHLDAENLSKHNTEL